MHSDVCYLPQSTGNVSQATRVVAWAQLSLSAPVPKPRVTGVVEISGLAPTAHQAQICGLIQLFSVIDN